MAIQLGSAYGKVNLDVKGLIDGVRQGKLSLQSLAAAGQAMGQTLQNVGRTLSLALTIPILAMGAASIKAASDFEETKNKAIVVFGEMSDSVVSNADRAAAALGVSKTQYLDYASSIGAALTAGGMGVKEATELSEQAVQHFADLASFHNTQVEDAALAWQSAIRGQFEPIQKYFPFITQQYLLTYGTANGLIDANTKQLTANQRAIILNAIALDEQLNPALNDFAETSGGLANQQRILKAQFQDSLIMLGQNLLPIALEVVQGMNKMLEAFNKMPPSVQKAIIIFAGLLAALGPLLSILGTVISFISTIVGFANTLGGLGISLGSIAAAAGAAGTALVGLAASALTVILPLLLIIATIALVYLAFKNNFMGITTTAKQLWFIIKWGFAQMWAALKSGAAEALANLRSGWDAWVQQNKATFTGWATWIQNAWENVLKFFAKARDYIVQVFQRMNWSQVGKYVMLGLANGILMGIPALIAAGVKAASELMKAFDKKLDIRSPSGEFEKRGKYSWQGYMRGWGTLDPNNMAKAMANPVLNQNSSNQQNTSFHFASGLTIRQAQEMIAENNDRMFGRLSERLAGA
jgi:hypothetical protein